MDAEFVRADSDGSFPGPTPHDEPGGLEVDGPAGLLPYGPIDAQFHVGAYRERTPPGTNESDPVLAHVARNRRAPPVLDALFRLAVAQGQMNFKSLAPAAVVR